MLTLEFFWHTMLWFACLLVEPERDDEERFLGVPEHGEIIQRCGY